MSAAPRPVVPTHELPPQDAATVDWYTQHQGGMAPHFIGAGARQSQREALTPPAERIPEVPDARSMAQKFDYRRSGSADGAPAPHAPIGPVAAVWEQRPPLEPHGRFYSSNTGLYRANPAEARPALHREIPHQGYAEGNPRRPQQQPYGSARPSAGVTGTEAQRQQRPQGSAAEYQQQPAPRPNPRGFGVVSRDPRHPEEVAYQERLHALQTRMM